MINKSVFMDTGFLIALIDNSDTYHEIAIESYRNLIMKKWPIITTEAILTELGNALSKLRWRQIAYKWITSIKKSKTIFTVIPVKNEIFDKSLKFYGSRLDKEWGLTDCISFIIMQENSLTHALSTDHHFKQAGYITSMSFDILIKDLL
ncbi:PIN domain-containing protein [Candidatus Magnetomoraceae bacterium gMMP-15]